MAFMEKLEEQLKNEMQLTENGAVGYKTSGKRLLDMNFAVSSMRNWSVREILESYIKAYYEDPHLAVKWLFYLRDVRGNGMGERRVFRICMKWLCHTKYDKVKSLIPLIPEYGRYDDWTPLLDTKAKDFVISLIRQQLDKDMADMGKEKEISLLAKWLPSCNSSAEVTRDAARCIYKALGLTEKEYRQMLSKMRSYLRVVEVQMSADHWSEIEYSHVPSRANLIYGNAFLCNDEQRRREFLGGVKRGEKMMHAGTLFPSDIVARYRIVDRFRGKYDIGEQDDTLEELWRALPDYVQGDDTTMVVRDGSGSMTTPIGATNVTALHVSTALTIYFAERCKGQYANHFITFSSTPQMIDLSPAKTLQEKLEICTAYNDCTNTDLKAVFNLILRTAVEHKLPQEELPKNILIVSDMEFDHAVTSYWDRQENFDSVTLFGQIKEAYRKQGYQMPRLIFWNVCSRTNTIPLQENEAGVALVSGFSPAVYNMVLTDKLDPYVCLLKQLNAKRYEAVEKILQQQEQAESF